MAAAKITKTFLYAEGVQISVIRDVVESHQWSSFGPVVGFSDIAQHLKSIKNLTLSASNARYPPKAGNIQEKRFRSIASDDYHDWETNGSEPESSCSQVWDRCCEVNVLAGGGT